MSTKVFEPLRITDSFIQLGVPEFPMYLSKGERFMLIEGGTGATADIVVQQLRALGVDPERIESILLTHTHPDHIGGFPRLRKAWPHVKIIASSVGEKMLSNEGLQKQFLFVDRAIAKIMVEKGDIEQIPAPLEEYSFDIDAVVEDGDTIDLGSGVCWTVHSIPGHAPCQIALSEKKEETLVAGDATGFYSPSRDLWWPNYFSSLEQYCRSIQKLMTLPAQRVALSHNGVVDNPAAYLKRALKATERWHLDMLDRIAKGETPEDVAEERSKWVDSFAHIMPIQIQKDMCLLMIKRSQKDADKADLFG